MSDDSSVVETGTSYLQMPNNEHKKLQCTVHVQEHHYSSKNLNFLL